jgi:hypothetical protein
MSQVITGARGRVRIKGQVVGYVGGVNVTVEHTLTDVDVMGQLEVGDLAETGHKCNFSINLFKAIANANINSLPGQGESTPNSAANTGSESPIDTSTEDTVLPLRSQDYFDVLLEDDQTGEPFFHLKNCKWEGGTGQVDARGLWQGTWNFRAQRGHGL